MNRPSPDIIFCCRHGSIAATNYRIRILDRAFGALQKCHPAAVGGHISTDPLDKSFSGKFINRPSTDYTNRPQQRPQNQPPLRPAALRPQNQPKPGYNAPRSVINQPSESDERRRPR
ncbi:MAG: hypothetical protein NWQ35_03295 [Verrucomicrobiales bacterium]|nr:hypothetical protein [Verrucomicrobiales bacterium]MDP5004860.1 hypothetical protein [Verrucomicrobiales bacterium]